MQWLIWITEHDDPIAVVGSEGMATLIVRALSAYDNLVGAEMAAWYTPVSDPTDQRHPIDWNAKPADAGDADDPYDTTGRHWIHLLGERQRVRVLTGEFAGQEGYIEHSVIDARDEAPAALGPVNYMVRLDNGLSTRLGHDSLEGLPLKQPAAPVASAAVEASGQRQLTRAQIRALPDGEHALLTRLVRLHDPRPVVEYMGVKSIAIDRYTSRWRNHQEVERISIVAMEPEGYTIWADYDDTMAEENGDLMAEDYLMQLFSPEGEGRTVAEIEASERL